MLSKKLKNSLSTHSRAIPQVLTHGLDTRLSYDFNVSEDELICLHYTLQDPI